MDDGLARVPQLRCGPRGTGYHRCHGCAIADEIQDECKLFDARGPANSVVRFVGIGWRVPVSSSPPPIRQQFVEAMSRIAASVSIVSTDGEGGRYGLTVSAVTSVTADPPTLLVCINRKNPLEAAIRANGVLLVSMLRADQRAVAQTFSGRPWRGNPYDFSTSLWVDAPSGAPRLTGTVAWFDCRVFGTHSVGTHTIFISRVEHAGFGEGMPLVYGRRSFAEIMHLPDVGGDLAVFPDPIWDEPAEEEWSE